MSTFGYLDIERRKQSDGSAATFSIEIDGRNVGRMKPGESITVPVESGKRLITLRQMWMKPVSIDLAINEDERIHLFCETEVSGILGMKTRLRITRRG